MSVNHLHLTPRQDKCDQSAMVRGTSQGHPRARMHTDANDKPAVLRAKDCVLYNPRRDYSGPAGRCSVTSEANASWLSANSVAVTAIFASFHLPPWSETANGWQCSADCPQTAQTHGLAPRSAPESTSSETATTPALQAAFAACWAKAMACSHHVDSAWSSLLWQHAHSGTRRGRGHSPWDS